MAQYYAYGADNVRGNCCPAVAAGFDPRENGKLLQVAETYDDLVSEFMGQSEGTLHESQAEKYWIKAVDSVRRRADEEFHRDEEHAEYLDDAVEFGEEVTEELFE